MSKKVFAGLFWIVMILGLPGCGTATTVVPHPSSTAVTETVEPVSPVATAEPVFDGERAYADVGFQVDLGPRIPGTEGHAAVIDWMVGELEAAGWVAEVQAGEYLGNPIRNVVAKRADTAPGAAWIILGAHFDSRSRADQDPDPARQNDPVPGANDGASGVAVLLELARVLPIDLEKNVWLVFFDAEDDGRIEGKEWIMGSSFFVEQLTAEANAPLPDAAVVVDMIGDADLNVYLEMNSDPKVSAEIWGVAASLGYQQQILPFPKYRMLDDHIPFKNVGIPAVDLIDFDYPYWHTVEDTTDKVSAESLDMIGETLLKWLLLR
ncbi:MAG: M28 family peptidase [Anaerolineales bacterium]|nr:M28 family peptidase [Anaerolineales bacterium]